MNNVVDILPARNPDVVLEKAIGVYTDCLILGYDPEGYLNARASLGLGKPEMLLLIEQFKFKLLAGEYDLE